MRLLDGLPFLKIYVFFAIGIILRECFPIASFAQYYFLISAFFLFVLSLFIQKRILWICAILFWSYGMHSIRVNKPNLYSGKYTVHATVQEEPIKKQKSYQLALRLNHLKKGDTIIPVETNQILIAYLSPAEEIKALRYGDEISASIQMDTIMSPLNPHEFNFKKNMERRDIYYRVFIHSSNLHIHSNRAWSIKKICFEIRRTCIRILEKNIPNTKSLNIAKSLIIGDRTQIDAALIDAYSNTGTIHILSVSGLHVGVFVWLLGFFFNKYLPSWRISRFTMVLFFVWIYGLISGMSPPVMRCAIMFSIIELGILLDRKVNILNLIAGAAYLILLFDTRMLFDLGYQLSFLAMTGIVLLHQPIYSKIILENAVWDKIWGMFCGTFSAWLFTFPIILFNFHKISLLGNLANLIAIPISSGILYAGLLLFIAAPISFIAQFLGIIIDYAIQVQDKAILLFESIPLSFLNHLVIGEYALWTLYAAMSALLLYVFFKKINYLIASILCLNLFAFLQNNASETIAAYELISFNTGRNSVLGIKKQDTLFTLGDTCAPYQQNKIQSFALAEGVKTILSKSDQVILFKNKRYLYVQQASIASSDYFELAILSQKACRGYKRLLNEIKAEKWILDSSISPYYRTRIENELKKRNISYYSVSPTNFAFIQKL